MIALLGALATAILVHLGTGLHPHAAVAWLIPLPTLLLAARRNRCRAWLAAGVGTVLGYAGMWSYCRRSLELPVPLVLGYLALPAGILALVVAGFTLLVRRGRLIEAMFWVPAAWTAAEYAIATLTPAGTFLSLANSQSGIRPILNLAALTGSWGITFLLMLVPAAVAALAVPGRHRRAQLAVAAVVPMVLGLGYGYRASSRPPAPTSLRVGLIALPGPSGYPERIDALQGVQLIVLPEATFTTDDTNRTEVLDALRHHGSSVITGLRDSSSVTGTRNLAVLLEGSAAPVVYVKERLIPGVEADFEPGDGSVITGSVDSTVVRLLICKDLDFPATVRRAGAEDLLVAPAWDFHDDARLHARIALLRAVENGVPLVRTARDGELLAADRTGRILGETTQPGDYTGVATGDAELVVDVPINRDTPATPYRRFGDWFVWLCLLIAASTLSRTRVWRRTTSPQQARQ
jgi:apolipoprotein N-acyltransferase